MVTFILSFQIAAKIGVDAGPPPTNNNTASDGFPFTAQKRQLEDAGIGHLTTQCTVFLIKRFILSPNWINTFLTCIVCIACAWQMNRRVKSWLLRVTWIQPMHCVSASLYSMFPFCAVIKKIKIYSWHYLVETSSCNLFFSVYVSAIGAQLAALAQQR